jgi:DNA-binding FrmR family transcriptional regulator
MIDELKHRALHRTKILEGQMRGLQRMIENEDYCMDIVTQSLAIQKSLGSLNKLLVENHLRTHVTDMMNGGEEQQAKAIDEMLRLFELNNNRGEK